MLIYQGFTITLACLIVGGRGGGLQLYERVEFFLQMFKMGGQNKMLSRNFGNLAVNSGEGGSLIK